MTKSYARYLKEILIDESAIQKRVAELGDELTADYAGVDDLLLLCVLKGGVMFLCDLMRHVDVPHAIDFMAVSSYGSGARASTGQVRIEKDMSTHVTDRHVLIVEDIIDTGHTLRFVMDMLASRQPASLKLCTLLDKPERREVDIPVAYVGFTIENKFVFGYGLDLDEKFRNLPFVGEVDLDKLDDK